jgi:hypothetical protein
MKIAYNKNANTNANFEPAPEYNGTAKIVDYTELKEYEGFNPGDKPVEKFRYILELNEERETDKNWTVSTKPLRLSMHEKASLYKFVESVVGKLPDSGDFDQEDMIGKYCSIITEQTESNGKIYTNIKYVGKNKSNETWESTHIRLKDRNNTADTSTKTVTTKTLSTDPVSLNKAMDEMFPTKKK